MSTRAARAAQQILRDAGMIKPPVDVEQVARSLGARIRFDELEQEISGMLVTRAGRQPVIVVNRQHHKNRQRFTIGHEVGHMLLHRVGKLHVDHVAYRDAAASTGELRREREANAFAAELLMPEQLLRDCFLGAGIHPYNLDDEDLENLAREFGVSVHAMTYRLINLGLLDG